MLHWTRYLGPQTIQRESRGKCAFSLVELLVVMAILGIVLGVLLPALGSVRSATKSLVCTSNLKSLSLEFHFFARGEVDQSRRHDNAMPGDQFWINDFQDYLYGLDEFWNAGEAQVATLRTADNLMLCPAGAMELVKRKGIPCSPQSIGPIEDVSMGINMRLYRAVVEVKGKSLLAPAKITRLSPRVLDHSHVPLIMDVDGKVAATRGIEPFYTSPPAGGSNPYANGRYWFPSRRHGGKTIVGFIGGHVLSSRQPEREKWDWTHQAEVGR